MLLTQISFRQYNHLLTRKIYSKFLKPKFNMQQIIYTSNTNNKTLSHYNQILSTRKIHLFYSLIKFIPKKKLKPKFHLLTCKTLILIYLRKKLII